MFTEKVCPFSIFTGISINVQNYLMYSVSTNNKNITLNKAGLNVRNFWNCHCFCVIFHSIHINLIVTITYLISYQYYHCSQILLLLIFGMSVLTCFSFTTFVFNAPCGFLMPELEFRFIKGT